jgi:hypothetical protein
MKQSIKPVVIVAGVAIVVYAFLIYNDLLAGQWMSAFMDLEFILAVLYIVFIYPTRKAQLQNAMFILIIVHFSVYVLYGITLNSPAIILGSSSVVLGVALYLFIKRPKKEIK